MDHIALRHRDLLAKKISCLIVLLKMAMWSFFVSDGLVAMVSGRVTTHFAVKHRSRKSLPISMGDLDRVQRYRGCLALQFGADSTMKQAVRAMLALNNQCPRFPVLPEDEWHMTLVTKEERQGLSADAVQEAMELSSTRCFAVGLGGGGGATTDLSPSGVYFVVCVWPKAQAFRIKYGLPLKDFHVSVSTANRHDIDKTSDALLDDTCLSSLDKSALEALSRQVMLEHKPERALEIATLLCARFSDETLRGWVRLADAALLAGRLKLAMLSYGHLIKRMAGGSLEDEGGYRGSPLWRHCCEQVSKCVESTEWGSVFVDGEIEQVPQDLRSVLCTPWNIAMWLAIRDGARNPSISLSYPPRERLTTPYAAVGDYHAGAMIQYSLPRFFRWIVPFQLAAMSTPRNRDDIRCLCYSLHVRHIVTLTEEEPLPAAWFDGLPTIKNTFLPVANYHAPSIPQIDMFMRLCCTSKTPVLVHCGGGKGRAGTMIACYLVAFGFAPPSPELYQSNIDPNELCFQPAMTAAEAILALRTMRPGSIETQEQEEAVGAYCSLLWKRRGVFPPEPAQPTPSRPEITGKSVETTDLLVLCGIPGSGKSSFRRALMKRSIASRAAPRTVRADNALYQPWTEIHSDEVGRKGCERSIGQKGLRRAILDRCNGVAADRKKFLGLAATWSQHATAVVFDTPTKLCEARAMQRADHPTLPPGRRVGFAIHQHSSTFENPDLAEGFQTIVRVTSVEAALELVEMLSPPLPLLKFPRTAHLIDLGAATSDDLITAVDCVSPPADENTTIVITEKLDGANMGISLSADGALVVQNRSHVINSETHRQFRALDEFLDVHRAVLYEVLHRDPLFPGRFTLYGEWLAATHSIAYSRLRSLFYAFDLFDRETGEFWDRSSLAELLAISAASCDDNCAIQLVPKLWEGRVLPPRDDLVAMAQQRPSQFYDGPVEGIYVKWERHGRVKERSKIVRSDFLAGDTHWSQRPEGIRFNSMLKLTPTPRIARTKNRTKS